MNYFKEVIKEASIITIKRQSSEYIKRVDIEKFLFQCEGLEAAIIGIEGFRLKGQKIQPDMDMIADFSGVLAKDWDKFQKSCFQAARKFFELIAHDKNLVFDMVLFTKEEWLRKQLKR